MITTFPYGQKVWVCLLCGAETREDVEDVMVAEGNTPGYAATLTCGGMWFNTLPMATRIHHCPDGSLGAEVFIGIKRLDKPTGEE